MSLVERGIGDFPEVVLHTVSYKINSIDRKLTTELKIEELTVVSIIFFYYNMYVILEHFS